MSDHILPVRLSPEPVEHHVPGRAGPAGGGGLLAVQGIPTTHPVTWLADTSASAEVRLWAAGRVIEQHAEAPSEDRAAGTCRQCEPGGGCEMLAWALATTQAPS